jgi:hypothetical protein
MSYTRIGNVVHVQGQFSVGSVSSPTGGLSITGLPFVVGGSGEQSGYSACLVRFYNLTGSSIGSPTGYFAIGTSYISCSGFNGLTTDNDIADNLQVDSYIMISGTYTV